MSQLDELEAIFGRKPAEQAESEEEGPDQPEMLQVYVTTSHKDTYRLVTIDVDHAWATLPILMKQVGEAVALYLQANPEQPRD